MVLDYQKKFIKEKKKDKKMIKNCISCNHKCHCNESICPRCLCSKCVHLEDYEEALTLNDEYVPWWKKILKRFI